MKGKFNRILAMCMITIIISISCMNHIWVQATEIPETSANILINSNIQADIVWNNTTSTYELMNNIDIFDGATLTIAPGTIINGNGYAINIYGTLNIDGASLNDVNLKGCNLGPTPFGLDIKNSTITGGSLLNPTGNPSQGNISIRDNRFKNLSEYSYIWYPTSSVYIERNVFQDCGGLSIGTDYNVYIRNNVFQNCNSKGYVIESWETNNNSNIYVEYNSFYDDGVILSLKYNTAKMEAKNNFWNTIEEDSIMYRIIDGESNFGAMNAINYLPILIEPHPNTPTFEGENEIPLIVGSQGTQYVGDITTDTIWNNIECVYELTTDIEIKNGVTLTIAPGTIINGNGHTINIYGILNIYGAKVKNVNLKGCNLGSSPFGLDIRNSIITGGSLLNPTGNSAHGDISISDNRFKDLSGYSYIWYPTSIAYIERNVFQNCGALSIGTNYNVYIRNNVFQNCNSKGYVIESWANYNNSNIYAEYNSFYDDGIVLSLKYDTAKIEAKNNFWNTIEEDSIKYRILDGNSNFSTLNTINYLPILVEPHHNTPTFEGENEIPLIVGSQGTQYIGKIITDTIWNNTESVYELTTDIDIKNGVTLTIAPGTIINGNGHTINIYGTLNIDSATINNVNLKGYNIGSSSFGLNIKNSRVVGGSLLNPTGNSSHGNISIRDNYFKNLSGYSYIWYPTSEVYIERNVFQSCGGLSIGTADFNAYIRNNVFEKCNVNGYVIQSWATNSNSNIYVEYNSFYDEGTILKLLYSTSKMVGKNNYWNTTIEDTIKIKIIDKNTDANVSGVIEYSPILIQPHSDTPSLPIKGIELSSENVYLNPEKKQVLAIINKLDTSIDYNAVSWKSSNVSVATVESNGTIVAVGEGQTTITVSYGDYTASCQVIVNKLGDVTLDSYVDIFDILAIQRHILGITIMDESLLKSADITNDDIIDVYDILSIQRRNLGIEN